MEALISYLENFATEERLAVFQQALSQRTRHLTVVLENLFQSHNASAVLRSCECMGVQDVHIIEYERQFSPTRGISNGAEKWLNTYKYSGLEAGYSCVDSLEEQGYDVYLTSPNERSVSIFDLPIERKTALIFGEEKNGVTPEIQKKVNKFVFIPMYGMTESFNISVAVALSVSHLVERMKSKLSPEVWQLPKQDSQAVYLDWLKKSIKSSSSLVQKFMSEQKHSSLC